MSRCEASTTTNSKMAISDKRHVPPSHISAFTAQHLHEPCAKSASELQGNLRLSELLIIYPHCLEERVLSACCVCFFDSPPLFLFLDWGSCDHALPSTNVSIPGGFSAWLFFRAVPSCTYSVHTLFRHDTCACGAFPHPDLLCWVLELDLSSCMQHHHYET